MGHPQIAAFARIAKGSPKPARTIGGQITRLTRGTHDIRYDPVHDEILLAAPHADAILTFRGGADGAVAPIRILQGAKTQIQADRLDVDPIHNEIFIPAGDRILVFPREAEGDVAPIRVIRGPDTGLRRSSYLAVDTVHDLLVVGAYAKTAASIKDETDVKLLFFGRTDEGNVKPRGEILIPQIGPQRTSEQLIGQMQVYPPKGWVIVPLPGADRSWESGEFTPFIGVWSINDRGLLQPRWKLGGTKTTLLRPRGVVLEPKSKEFIVSDMRQNAILTFSFPELF